MAEESEVQGIQETELLALKRMDETSIVLQEQGNYLEALDCMERGLVLRQHLFGSESDQLWDACKVVGDMCNLLAVNYLEQEEFCMALELLKKAEILTERDQPRRAVTFNNLACYYRRQGRLRTSLQYLNRALRIEEKSENVKNAADTHLNACVVLSQLDRHLMALQHAQAALVLLQEDLFKSIQESEVVIKKSDKNDTKEQAVHVKLDRIAVLCIAHHNTGVEQEFLKRYDQSLQSYRKGKEIADQYLGHGHSIAKILKKSYWKIQNKMKTKMKSKHDS